eukprot:7428914-Ditylum_brightwellii.AAC.1
MGDLKLASHVTQLALWAPLAKSLGHIINVLDSFVTHTQASKGTISKLSTTAILLMWRAHILHQHQMTSSTFFLPSVQNTLTDCVSRHSHLAPTDLLALFNMRFPQQNLGNSCSRYAT